MLCNRKHRPRQTFSVRELLLSGGDLEERLRAALACAVDYMGGTSTSDLLEEVFVFPSNRELLASAVEQTFHVGFMLPSPPNLSQANLSAMLSRAAGDAGLSENIRTFASTIVARELGELVGKTEVPTEIFKACGRLPNGTDSYVEVFFPSIDHHTACTWVAEEVGTHVGLTLTDAAAFDRIARAFELESFGLPRFMQDKGSVMTNRAEGVSVVYFDKGYDDGNVRIEVLRRAQGDMP